MLSLEMLDYLAYVTQAQKTLDTARLTENSFTRNRGMPFPDALSFMLDMRTTTLQTRLNIFCKEARGCDPISQQAFSKLRMNFDHSPFETMTRGLVNKEYSGSYDLPLWHGYHVFGIDGSYLQLPRVNVLRNEFGVRGGGGTCPSAGISVLYDVLHGWAVDPIITKANMNERNECKKHIDFLVRELPQVAHNSIITMDRGYPSLDLLETLQRFGLKFVVRSHSKFVSEVTDAPLGDCAVSLSNGITVRIIKFVLSSGEVETLVTNLFDIAEELFPELYALRWKVESAYFCLKRELCVEKFSGKTPNSIRQDFWASMVLLNAVSVFQSEADEVIHIRQSDKHLTHEYRARTSGLIITLRDRFIFAVLCGNSTFAPAEMEDVIRTMAREVSAVRPHRSFPRKFKPNLVVNHNLKSHL